MMKYIQQLAFNWATRAFGFQHVMNKKIHALRLLEEAIELAQAEGIPLSVIDRCVATVCARPVGYAAQEIGGVLMASAVYCSSRSMDMEYILVDELERVLAKPIEHFAARNQEKINLGLTI